jgi:hypothetical protein
MHPAAGQFIADSPEFIKLVPQHRLIITARSYLPAQVFPVDQRLPVHKTMIDRLFKPYQQGRKITIK